jgi:hypothetical protein
MRDLHLLDRHRLDSTKTYGWSGDGTCGAFKFPSPIDGQSMVVIASSTDDWDHVSVTRSSRVPNWVEMEFIRRKFFKDDECVMQLHVPPAEHINCHPNCLHLWRPQLVPIPRPPGWMVAPQIKKGFGTRD